MTVRKNIQILLMSIILAGCSAQQFYHTTINAQRTDAGLVEKTIRLSFGDISYLENGIDSDESIILLHGFGGEKDLWNRFSDNLNGYHIIAIDLPGHGKSVASEDLGYSIAHQSVMLEQFLAAKKIHRVHLVGNSMGGAIALKYSSDHASRVRSLILVDALAMLKTKSEYAEIISATGVNPFFDLCTVTAYERYIHITMEKPPYIPGAVMKVLMAEKCSRAALEKVIFKDMLTDAELGQQAAGLELPTLIIWGARDRVVHVDSAHLLNNTIKGSKLVILNGLGHVPLLEDAEKMAQVVNGFISTVD